MTHNHDFGWALEQLRMGARVSRAAWTADSMYVVYQKAYPDGIPINENTSQATGLAKGTVCKFLPYLMFKSADNSFVPWIAVQNDLLAFDWGYDPSYVTQPS